MMHNVGSFLYSTSLMILSDKRFVTSVCDRIKIGIVQQSIIVISILAKTIPPGAAHRGVGV